MAAILNALECRVSWCQGKWIRKGCNMIKKLLKVALNTKKSISIIRKTMLIYSDLVYLIN